MTKNRNNNKQIAENTIEILKTGFYEVNDKTIDITEMQQNAVSNSILLKPEWQPKVDFEKRFETEYSVVNCTSLQACEQVKDENAMCLNFASAKNPGGGFLGGSQAQEESLARSSGLYYTLTKHQEYYQSNRENRIFLYLDYMIYSPKVPVIKNDQGDLFEQPYTLSFITAPAVNAGVLLQRQPHLAPEIEPTMKRRIERVLTLAAEKGHQTLVLGAWGCGVFRNDPKMIARLFAEALLDKGAFAGVFKKVVFAVLDRKEPKPRFEAFSQAFSSN
ncbi:MAG: TIGR02452 family protein [Bacteroidia bacterium]